MLEVWGALWPGITNCEGEINEFIFMSSFFPSCYSSAFSICFSLIFFYQNMEIVRESRESEEVLCDNELLPVFCNYSLRELHRDVLAF